MVAVLVRLHRITRRWHVDLPDPPDTRWTDHTTEAALTCFPVEIGRELEPMLRTFQQEAAGLQQRWCWIAGDASPPNWGVRGDDSVVLFDWELFRLGLPASDLAPAVPGFADLVKMRAIAASYIAESKRQDQCLPWGLDELTRQIAVAKVVTVVLLLTACVENEARISQATITRLIQAIPAWLRSLR
jgi:aminoglycoside phosphotransferase (APT) family kinase protein